MKTLTVDVVLIAPSGRQILMTLAADEVENAVVIDLIDNAEEFLQWSKAEKMGSVQNGYMN